MEDLAIRVYSSGRKLSEFVGELATLRQPYTFNDNLYPVRLDHLGRSKSDPE